VLVVGHCLPAKHQLPLTCLVSGPRARESQLEVYGKGGWVVSLYYLCHVGEWCLVATCWVPVQSILAALPE